MYLIISDQFKLNLWWSAKCGCTYLKNLYFNHVLKLNIKNVHLKSCRQQKYYDNGYKNIYICRNPYARIVSSFLDRCVRNDFFYRFANFEDFIQIMYDYYVNGVKYIFTYNIIHHTTPQFSELFLETSEEYHNFRFDIIYKLEEVTDQQLLKELFHMENSNLQKDFGHSNNVQKNKIYRGDSYRIDSSELYYLKYIKEIPHYSCFYNEKIKRQVEAIYQKDFEQLKKYGIHYEIDYIVEK